MVGTKSALSSPFAAMLLLSGVTTANAAGIADNLGEDSGGVGTASGNVWEAQSFTTDNQAYLLDSVSLLIASLDDGTTVNLYSDAYSAPSQVLATLAPSGAYAASLAITAFSGGDFALAANTTYWIVLSNLTGSTEWSFQATDDGTSNAWAEWDGTYWSTSTSYPYQMNVSVTPAAVPVPMSLPLMMTGLASLSLISRRARRDSIV